MGQNEKVEKAPKTSWFSGLKAEFQKIIWPEAIGHQTDHCSAGGFSSYRSYYCAS